MGAEAEMEGRVSSWKQLTGAPIGAATRGAGSWLKVTVWILSPSGAETPERSQRVMAGSALGARSRVQETLVDIVLAGMALEAGWAEALDLGVCGQTHPSIDAGVGRAEVLKLTLLT